MQQSLVLFRLIIIILFIAGSCKDPKPGKTNPVAMNRAEKRSVFIKKPASSFGDTILVQGKSAVFYLPDSLQMAKIKAVNDKLIFQNITHDCHYQMMNARDELKQSWPQVRIMDCSKARYLLFVKTDKSKICIDLDEKNDICGIFLFDGKKNPALIDMPNVSTALGFYFK